MDNPNIKTCTKCGETKSTSEFGKHSVGKDGLRSVCKICNSKASKEWYLLNPEKAYASRKSWAENNKIKVSEIHKNWRMSNKEKHSENGKKWATENPDKYAIIKRKADLKRRSTILNNETFAIRKCFLKRLYESSCIYCGSRERIEADHIIPIAKGGRHSEGNLQPLCKSCNSSKGDKLMIEWRMWMEKI